MTVCAIKYFEVSIIQPISQALLAIVSVLSECLESSVEFRDNVWQVELVDEVKWGYILSVMFGCVVDSWRRRRWRGDLFDEWHSGLKCLFGEFLVVPLRRGCVGFFILLGFVWHCPGFAPVPMCCHQSVPFPFNQI